MSPIDLGFLVLSVLFCAAFLLLGALSRRFHRDEIFRGVTPFWIADIFRLALLVGVPWISLWLVVAMG